MEKKYTYDYFISYRRANGGVEYAKMIRDILFKYNKKVFWDLDSMTKGDYRQQIVDTIENSKEFILILNNESWRETKIIDTYYNEIIMMVKEQRNIIPIECSEKILDKIPEVLRTKLHKNLKDYQTVKYIQSPDYDFESALCRILRLHDNNTMETPKTSLSIIGNLIPRDYKVEELYHGICVNRVFNLNGIGGSGKTSLAFLLADKYKDLFGQIIYIVVGINIKEDFVAEINKKMKLQLDTDESLDDKFQQIITHLNIQKDHNLLILDINETSEQNANNDFVDELIEIPSNWKILIISRERYSDFQHLNLNDDNDIEFLKEVFLSKAGDIYTDFKSFDELFSFIHFNPLLAEQLGFYLCNKSKKKLDEIKQLFYDESFRKKRRRGGVISTKRREENIKMFLKRLIIFKNFSKNEQIVLRHFVLWPSEYIEDYVIKDLLKGVCDELEDTLSVLSDRAILSFDNKKSAYKLHGLLAESLCEQIEFEKEDWSIYLKNYERISEYEYEKFVPFANCIGSSMVMQVKYTNTIPFIDEYVDQLTFNKIMRKNAEELGFVDLKKILESSNSYDGILEALKLMNITSVNLNEAKSISLQKEIKILEEDNCKDSESIDKLSNLYFKLACIYSKETEKNIKHAIKIQEDISTQKPIFLRRLIQYNLFLANFYFDNGKIEEAKTIVEEIKNEMEKLDFKDPENQRFFRLWRNKIGL